MDLFVGDLAKKLKSSPMFQLSISSLELFHSNFLAWLFETHPSSLEILDVEPPSSCIVKREQKHIDLSIESDGQTIAVIENKVKSLPDMAQLEHYGNVIEDGMHRILLTLLPASFDSKSVGWTEISYENLSAKLKTGSIIRSYPSVIVPLSANIRK